VYPASLSGEAVAEFVQDHDAEKRPVTPCPRV